MQRIILTTMLLISASAEAQQSARESVPLNFPKSVEVEMVRPSVLQEFEQSGSYVCVETDVLKELLRRQAAARLPLESQVRLCELSATYVQQSLKEGSLVLELERADAPTGQTVSLGQTSLNSLRLYSQDVALTLATDADGNLIPLVPPASKRITGTWETSGARVGMATNFDLRLPTAAVAVFHLQTDINTSVTSSNSLVVPVTRSEEHIEWDLYPRDPSILSLSCVTREAGNGGGDVGLSVAAKVRVDARTATVSWELAPSPDLHDSRLNFAMSLPCTVKSVQSGNTPLKWTINEQRDLLIVDIPSSMAASTMVIDAVLDRPEDKKLTVPFLVPKTWTSDNGQAQGRTHLHSGLVRLVVSPEVMVTDLELSGLLERDIAYSSDGIQTLELSQFSQDAAATVFLAPATPVVDDSVVIRVGTGDRSGQATAFIYITARSGSPGQFRWVLPRSWRVTDVRETASGLPLLFRVTEPADSSAAAEVDVFLRAPVSGESGQGIVAKLQSTDRGTSSSGELPGLVNQQYNRQTDLLCLDASDVTTAFSANNSEVAATPVSDELLEKLSWLPPGELESVLFFRRLSRTSRFESAAEPRADLYSTVDYSVVTRDASVTESIRLRLRCAKELPRRIPLQITTDVSARVSAKSVTQPAPILTRDDAAADSWTLEFPSGTQAFSEIDIILICDRPVADRMPVTLPEVVGARQTGGTIQPPDDDSLLLLNGEVPLTQAEQYPVVHSGGWTLLRSTSSVSSLDIAGSTFVIIHEAGSHFVVEVMQRMVLNSHGSRAVLEADFPNALAPAIFVNGQSVFADRKGRQLRIPLDRDSPHAAVTVAYSVTVNPTRDNSLALPLMTFPSADTARFFTFILPPADYRLDTPAGMIVRPTHEITELLADSGRTIQTSGLEEYAASFRARWQLASLHSAQTACTSVRAVSEKLAVQLRSHRFDVPMGVLWTTMVVLVWIFVDSKLRLAMWIPGALLVAAVLWPFGEAVWAPVQAAVLVGTILFGLMRGCRAFAARVGRRFEGRPGVVAFRTSLMIIAVLLPAPGLAQNEASRPLVLIPSTDDGSIPFACVKKDFLSELQNIRSPDQNEALVASSAVTVTMESPQSCFVAVRCVVACDPDRECRLTIPLTGLTLVDCVLDNQGTFPVRDPSGRTQVVISSDRLLPARVLGTPAVSPASPGPDVLGQRNLHTVEYRVRGVPNRSPRDYRLTVPYPPSAQTIISFSDRSNLVEQVSILTASDSLPMPVVSGLCRFPALFNSRSVDLSLRIRDAGAVATGRQQQSSVVCIADIIPTQQRLTCEYRVVPADSRFTKVMVGTDPRFKITSVRMVNGDPVTWTPDTGRMVAEVTPDADGVQEFVVQQVFEPSTNLRHDLPVSVFSTINGLAADSTRLFVGTSDQFVIDSVSSGGTPLDEVPVTSAVREFRSRIEVPQTAASVVIQLAQLEATRVARLTQKVIVSDAELDWSCRCEIDVAGQPVFRQSIRVSPNVRVTDVSVRSDGVSRLQSWTRHGDQVVVSLIEATRGLLELDVHGQLPRLPDRDTALPVIQLPAAIEITESVLELSADVEVDTFIRNLGSAVPSDLMNIDKIAIPATPMHMSISDETQPLVIRNNAQKLVTADVAVFLYEIAGECRCAQFLNLHTPNVAFDIRFRCPQPDFGSFRSILVRDGVISAISSRGGDFVIPRSRAAGTSQLTLAFADMPAEAMAGKIASRIPNFESEIRITGCQAFDLREVVQVSSAAKIPNWAVDAAIKIGIAEDVSLVSPADSRFVADSQQVIVQPARTRSAPTVATETPGILLVQGQHLLTFSADASVAGASSLMVFRSQPESQVTLHIPQATDVAEIRVDGESQAFRVENGSVVLNPRDRVTDVTVVWFRQEAEHQANREWSLALPDIPAPHSFDQAVIVPASPQSIWWSVQNEKTTLSALYSTRDDALNHGLRLLGLDPVPESGAAPNVGVGGISQHLWQLIADESATAASASAQFFEDFDDRARVDGTVVNLHGAERIRISSRDMPRPLTGLSILSALAMIILPWFSRTAQRKTPEAAENPEQPTSVTAQETVGSTHI